MNPLSKFCASLLCVSGSIGFGLLASIAHGQQTGASCWSSFASQAPLTARLRTLGSAGTLIFEDEIQRFRLAGLTEIAARGVGTILKQGRTYLIYRSGEQDRYGCEGVHLVGDGTTWVQGALLAKSFALAQSSATMPANCLAALRLRERAAESRKVGIWSGAGPNLSAQDLDRLREQQGRFVLVQGVVASVGDRKRRVYLNFGEKWDQDFTVSLAKSGRGAFKGDMTRILATKGVSIRVRGVLEWSGGPLIRVLDEGQIELALP